MKTLLCAISSFALLVSTASGAGYVLDLSGGGYSNGDNFAAPGPVGGVDGWEQSEANFSDAFGDYPRSWVSDFSGGVQGFAVGGYYDTFDPTSGSSISVSQSLSGLLQGNANLQVDLALIDSDDFDEDRNRFSFGFYDSSNAEIVSLVFRPVSQSPSPGSENAFWNVHASVQGVLNPSAFAAVSEGATYTVGLNLSASSLNDGEIDFFGSVSSGGGTESSYSDSFVASSSDAVAGLQVVWAADGTESVAEGSNFGSNYVAVSSLTAVPEVSSSLLLLLTSLGLLRRKRH